MNYRKHITAFAATAALVVACGGGDATAPTETPAPTPTPAGTPAPTPTPTPTPAPTPTPTPTPTSGFGFVPNGSGGNYGLNCVKDYSTGLTWEGKSPNPSALTYAGREFTNYDSTASLQIPNRSTGSGFAPTTADINAITNTVGYKNAVNSIALCGFSDWRLPTKEELLTLVDTSLPSDIGTARINATWFPYTSPLLYWTSAPSTSRSYQAWYVVFWNGTAMEGYRDVSSAHIRLVR
jgi:Protein of unknown function (DUF1566)